MRRAGFPLIPHRISSRKTIAHQCGTARRGLDPATSVVTPEGRPHEVANLWVTDASIPPTSATINAAPRVAALALMGQRRPGLRRPAPRAG